MKKCTVNFMSETEVNYEVSHLIPTTTWDTLSEAEQANFEDATEEEIATWNEAHPELNAAVKEEAQA